MTAIKQQMNYALALGIVVLAVSCSVLPEREPTRIYEPARAAVPAPPVSPPVSWSLVVAKPLAGQLLEDDGIVVRPAPGVVQVYKAATWSDPVPDIVQTSIVRALEDSGRILSVSRPGGTIQGDYQLITELRAFESVYTADKSVQAQIDIYAKLVRSLDGRVVAVRSFRESEPAASEELGAVVEAFSRVLDRATVGVVGWTLASGNQAPLDSAKP